jgi:copper(I)-binding protein
MNRFHAMTAGVLALLSSTAGPASAHAFLKSASPAVGSEVSTPPAEVVIDFTEGVEPKFSTIMVQDGEGVRMDSGAAHLVGGVDTRLAVALKPLTQGAYKVVWHATATDTHKTEGSFSFTVGRQAASAQTGGGSIAVENAWARATPPMAKTGAVYFTIVDHGAPDKLVAAATPVAGMAHLHETTMAGNVMQMRPIEGLDVADKVTLAPGGTHLMLTDLKQPLKQGDSFPLTLTFQHAGTVHTVVSVAGIGAGGPMPSGGMDMNMPMPNK